MVEQLTLHTSSSSISSLPRSTAGTIPANTMMWVGSKSWARVRLNPAGVQRTLQLSLLVLGVSGFQLARLLGMQAPNISYNQWSNGRNGMGSCAFGRLLELWWLKIQGWNICYMQKIDWEKGIIYWRKKGEYTDNLPRFGGGEPERKGEDIPRMADSGRKQKRQANAQSHIKPGIPTDEAYTIGNMG